jgi:hypothetical protein
MVGPSPTVFSGTGILERRKSEVRERERETLKKNEKSVKENKQILSYSSH